MDLARIINLIAYVLRISERRPRRDRWELIKAKHGVKVNRDVKENKRKKRPMLKRIK